tara:strand:- start:129 stop:389 length:261 start_codon:yes stop_codon:yes gene_type:complete
MLLDDILQLNEELEICSEEEPEKFAKVINALANIYTAVRLVSEQKMQINSEELEELLTEAFTENWRMDEEDYFNSNWRFKDKVGEA